LQKFQWSLAGRSQSWQIESRTLAERVNDGDANTKKQNEAKPDYEDEN
jgi:hypothetical protein